MKNPARNAGCRWALPSSLAALLFTTNAAAQPASPQPPPLAPTRQAFAVDTRPPSAPPPAKRPKSNTIVGIALTGAGVAMVAGGAAMQVLGACNEDLCLVQISGIGLWAAGIPHIVSGVALWIAGEAPSQPEYRNNAQRYAGIFLTTLASSALAAGLGSIAVGAPNPTNDANGIALVSGLSLASCSVALAAIGVPLWVLGARAPNASAKASLDPLPSIGVGFRSGSLRWSF